jgi:K(+)-stimulated pyrophosphate-energized sodium pump
VLLIGTAVDALHKDLLNDTLIKNKFGIEPETILNILNPFTIIGFLAGGAVIFWFTGASMQAVTTGAYRAVEYIKKNIRLDEKASKSASIGASKEVVKICTQYAQTGISISLSRSFPFALGFAFLAGYANSSDGAIA